MKNSTKGMLAAIPLVMGLAGPAAAALGESADAGDSKGSEVSIDNMLNQYGGLTPGDKEMSSASHEVPNSQKLSSLTSAVSSMNAAYTNQGVDRTSPNQPARAVDYIASGSTSGNSGSDRESAAVGAPSVASFTVAHAAADTLVGAVASGIASSSSSSPSIGTTADLPKEPVAKDPIPDPIPTPIPPAAALVGSGLTALLALRKRKKEIPA